MTMRENCELMKNEIDEVKMRMLKLFAKAGVEDMDADTFELLQRSLRLINASLQFTEAQVATMERLEEKLDMLLART